MNFAKLNLIMENDPQIEKTRRVDSPIYNANDLPQAPENPQKTRAVDQKPQQILPVRDILMRRQVGQDAAVYLQEYNNPTAFSPGWQVAWFNDNFTHLKKAPTDSTTGGKLIVPNNIYANWQVEYLGKSKKTNKFDPNSLPSEDNVKTSLGGRQSV